MGGFRSGKVRPISRPNVFFASNIAFAKVIVTRKGRPQRERPLFPLFKRSAPHQHTNRETGGAQSKNYHGQTDKAVFL